MRKSTSNVLVALIIILGILLSTLIICYTITEKIKNNRRANHKEYSINVTGFTEMYFKANIAEVQCKYLEKDKNSLINFFTKNGIKKEELIFKDNAIIFIKTEYINELEKIINSNAISKPELNLSNLKYFCTNTEELKIKLLQKATKNARHKAGTIAEYSGNNLGVLLHSNEGTVQYLNFDKKDIYESFTDLDTNSKHKIARIYVTQSYSIE